jgi:osmotically-inducible protein OsmY
MKSNADLQKDVYEELKWDNRIAEEDIGVSVNNGIVTLSGTIPSYAEKWAVDESTTEVAGVKAVVNNMNIKLPGSQVKDDQDIAEATLSALRWNAWVPSAAIKVMVEKGWVTLSGTVDSNYQKRQAEKVVGYLNGILGISNEINVEPTAKAIDIETQIKRAFHRHREEDPGNIEIKVSNGKVTLSGSVRSLEEKRRAESAAFRTDAAFVALKIMYRLQLAGHFEPILELS